LSTVQDALSKEELWNALVQTAHSLLMYKSHKRYVEETLLKERPEITAQELAVRLAITIGEALVLLSETRGGNAKPKSVKDVAGEGNPRSLLDYSM